MHENKNSYPAPPPPGSQDLNPFPELQKIWRTDPKTRGILTAVRNTHNEVV